MADRTPEERAAARLERRRRRGGVNSPPPPVTDGIAPPIGRADAGTEPEPEPQLEPEPEPEPNVSASMPRPVEIDPELPSGTRRMPRPAGQVRLPAKRQRPPRPRGPRARRRRLLALIPLILALALAWFLVELFEPFHGSAHGHITVKVPPHSSSSQIGDLLARDGVISSGFFFELRAALAGERGDLRSGTYHLQLAMTYGAVLKLLTTPPPAARTTQLTLIPGKSRGQIDALLRSQGIKGSYLGATRHSRLLNPSSYGAPRRTSMLEGFLFPSTYFLVEPISVSQLVAKELTAFKQNFRTINFGYARRHHLTPYDVLIIASMIEGEASTPRDRALVASVVYNRLRDGMPLQLDATTRYATDNYTRPLTQSELDSSSPYNTRIHTGLPPTPINSPGLASMQAAAHPASTNYLYFVVKPCGNGAEVFTGNYQQFLRDSAKYQSARAARGGRSPTHC